MKRFLFAGLCSLACVASAPAVPVATYNEIRAQQALGRVVTAPDGSFFLYEWMRPYTWTPEAKGLAPAAAARPQTWLYKVGTDYPVTPSYYLFHPHPRATYYLGDLSLDTERIAFYELDRTENTIRAGVLTFDHPAYPTINWFDAPPVSESLDQPALWISNDELAYRAKPGFVRGKLPAFKKRKLDEPAARDDLIKTSACSDCAARLRAKREAAQGSQTAKGAEAPRAAEIPKGAKLLARSENGEISVYAVDTPDALTLLYQKGDSARTLFENDRRPNKLARD